MAKKVFLLIFNGSIIFDGWLRRLLGRRGPSILVIGILDTKGREIRFLAEQIKKAGGNPIIMEVSCGAEVGWADIPVGELISKAGYGKDDVFKMDRMRAQEIIAQGGVLKVREMLSRGELDGAIAHGGATTTYIASRILQALPVGMPKIICSTLASGDCRDYVGSKDIAMLFPLTEMGLNKVSKRILSNAAGMIVGAAAMRPAGKEEVKPLIGCTILGIVAPCTDVLTKHYESKGYDVVTIHGAGSGRVLSTLVTDGELTGVLDIATHEIADLICGGDDPAAPDRLVAAEKGIPQIISTGGLDMIGFRCPKETLLKRRPRSKVTGEPLIEEGRAKPGRAVVSHTPSITGVSTSKEEAQKMAEYIVAKLNQARGPTVLLVPMRGWSRYDIKELPTGAPGPLWDGGSNINSNWSGRSVAFINALKKNVDMENPNLDVLICDMHINEPSFAQLCISIFDDMLRGFWRKRKYQDGTRIMSIQQII